MKLSEYRPTIDRHVQSFKSTEKLAFDRLLRFYQGKFYTDRESAGPTESELLVTSINLTFAITETALSTLVPRNPQVTALSRGPAPGDALKGMEGVVNLSLDHSDYYSELVLAVQDAVLYGRGVLKTVWDAKNDLPLVRACDMRAVFFDLTSRRPSDIRYWIEATVISEDEFKSRIKNGLYKPWANSIQGDTYPKWLGYDLGTAVSRQQLKDWQNWITVYEVYDIESNRVVHMHLDYDEPLLEDELLYCPYSVLTLNNNGEDCRGLSDIALISDNQEELNHIRTYLLNIARLSIPKTGYDSTALQSEDVAVAQEAPVGSMVGIRTTGGKSMADSFYAWPMPQPPGALFEMASSLEKSIATVSALADAQRGQVTGARTATELALVEGQLRNRLSARQRKIDTVTTQVAEQMAFLAMKFMREEKIVEFTGYSDAEPIHPSSFENVRAKFKVVPYSPMESNRAVLQEQFKAAMQFLLNNPYVDALEVTKQFLEVFQLSPRLLKPEQAPQGAPGVPPQPAQGMAAQPPVDQAAMLEAQGVAHPAAQMPPQQQAVANQAAAPISEEEIATT
jgi:hypothetical protein